MKFLWTKIGNPPLGAIGWKWSVMDGKKKVGEGKFLGAFDMSSMSSVGQATWWEGKGRRFDVPGKGSCQKTVQKFMLFSEDFLDRPQGSDDPPPKVRAEIEKRIKRDGPFGIPEARLRMIGRREAVDAKWKGRPRRKEAK